MKNIFFLVFSLIFLFCTQKSNSASKNKNSLTVTQIMSSKVQKITFKSLDGLNITANYYPNDNPEAKLLVLCHQAGYSRGEYIQTAEIFVQMGYQCLALDQRSGSKVNNITNETASRANKENISMKYPDAYPDLVAALKYGQETLKAKHIMFIGSSYSSSLVLIMAATFPTDIEAVACFSPGNYFKLNDLDVSDYALKVSIPTFITSAKNEKKSWNTIFENISSKNKVSFLPESSGFHGSKALWKENKGNKEYWNALQAFLVQYFPAS